MEKLLASLGVFLLLSGCSGGITGEEESTSEANPVERAEVAEELIFVPQKSAIDVRLSVENDEVLMSLNELITASNPDDIGFENDITIQFSGLYFESEDRVQPVFVIANRMDEAYTNIELALSFGLNEDELLFDETSFELTEEQFGVLEPNAVMPLYLDADLSQLELLEEIVKTRQEVISIAGLDFETVGSKL